MMAGWSETKPRHNTGGGDEHSRCCEVTNAGKVKIRRFAALNPTDSGGLYTPTAEEQNPKFRLL